jgi:hypothetical protein
MHMPVQGLVRLRKHQFARQAAFGTPVAAVRAYPMSGVPTPDLAWTDAEINAGSLYPVAPPTRGAPDLTAALTIPSLGYNTLPLILSGFFGGSVEPTGAGTAQTWAYAPSGSTPDDIDAFTYEFGDDVLTDWYQFGDGIIESFEISGPEGLGALSASTNWRFGSIASSGSTDSPDSPVVPTAGLTVDTGEVLVYLKDIGIYIASTVAGLAAGQVTDALHSFTFSGTREMDQKRYANADQSFDIDAYGHGAHSLSLQAVYAKTADTVGIGSESDAWMSDQAVNRYIRIVATATVEAQAGTDYSFTLTLPMRYYTREEGEIGGNTTVILTANNYDDEGGDLAGPVTATVVNTLTTFQLGNVPS